MLEQTPERIKARICAALRRHLPAWYRQHHRDLPWRRTRDPYAILVSEIMLQQTRVVAVIPYYAKWMAAFPTVESLARSRIDKVLSLWAGLGYYSRARNLHRAAQQIVKEHGGIVPTAIDALLQLPGIGRYTAGAIASVAFGQRAPILDGNVIRVLSRIFLIEQDTSTSLVRQQLWELAEQILPNREVGDFNQALMELGALVCLPENPRCSVCPLRRVCQARIASKVDQVPVLRARKPVRAITQYAALLRRDGEFLVERRPEGQLMAGLWTFPRYRSQRHLRSEFDGLPARKLGAVIHSVMDQRITVKAFLIETNGNSPSVQGRWVPRSRLRSLAFPSADRRLMELAIGLGGRL